jgi:hypothetical protein
MKMAIALGAALLVAPAAFAQSNQANQNMPNQNQPSQMGNQPSQMGNQPSQMGNQPSQMGNQPSQMGNQPSTAGNQMGNQPSNQPSQMGNQPSENQPSAAGTQGQAEDVTAKKLLPKDAKLIGSVEQAEVRAFPEQMSDTAKSTGKVEKEGVVGVGALDRVWTTKQAYKTTVSQLDRKLKGEGIEPIAKTTTTSATAWNVRMPDGHIANLVVRNTQPTTIETVQAAAMTGTVTEPNRNAPSSKTPMNK